DENGDPVNIDMNVGRLEYDPDNHLLTYTDENGDRVDIDMNVGKLEYDPDNHLLTYTDENGDPVNIDMNVGRLEYDPDNHLLTYTDENGQTTNLDMAPVVKNLETVTELGSEITTNTDGDAVYRLTYSAEDGVDDVIDVKANNGLNIDVTSGAIQLGGPLIKPKTTIQTDADNTLAIAGLEYSTATDDKIVVADAITGELKALKAAMPKFFYMPSIIIPTAADQVENPSEEPFGTIDLYKKYQKQFGSPQVSSPGAQPLPVLPANELYYYITWYDQMVFENITVDEYGVLRYEIKPDADVTLGSFMNIVFAVKQNL
ncbi:hypothetical protein, partial [Parapedobacter indicus]